jgi:hypothetical protein
MTLSCIQNNIENTYASYFLGYNNTDLASTSANVALTRAVSNTLGILSTRMAVNRLQNPSQPS